MILNCKSICKSYGTDVILDNVSFTVEDHEKVAVVGINGAGKSTLFKILMGEETADSGDAVWSKTARIGYLAQHQSLNSENTIYEEVAAQKAEIFKVEKRIREIEHEMKHESGEKLDSLLSEYNRLTIKFETENGYAANSEITGVLKGLGFTEEEFDRKVNTLSGGQKTRVALSRLLLSYPDIILLDEPTNHLDMNSIAWLETFLMNYKGAVIIIAHDRYFLDRVVSKVVELEAGKSMVYSGNYTEFAEKKNKLRETQIHHFLNQQREIKHQEEVIEKLRSFNREKSIKRAESREKMLDKIERLDKPVEISDKMNIRLEPSIISGNDVLSIKDIKKGFDGNVLFEDVNIELKRGDKMAIIGNNGTGKTTLLKIINGALNADEGEIKFGAKVHVGYYDQEHQVLSMEKTIFDEIQDTYPHMDNTRVRNTLAAFLFTGDDVFKLIKDLSGGERGRVSLAKLMLSEANLLILDEPTNHLDMVSKEILENALINYEGTLLFVSHDRYFINRVATRIEDLTNRHFLNYNGNYDYYLEKKEYVEASFFGTPLSDSSSASGSMAGNSKVNSSIGNAIYSSFSGKGNYIKEDVADSHRKSSITGAFKDGAGNPVTGAGEIAANSDALSAKEKWELDKQRAAQERKLKADIAKIEKRIEEIEARDAEIDEELVKEEVFTDPKKLLELNNEKKALESENEELMEKWEELSQSLEDF